jgi:hypothetical protein
MIMATAGTAASAARTASKLPEAALPGVGFGCVPPVSGLAVAEARGCGVELEDDGVETEQADASSSSTRLTAGSKKAAGPVVGFLGGMDSCVSR